MAVVAGTEDIAYFTERISDETLLQIIKFLDSHEDLVNLSETCIKFNRLLLDKDLCEQIKFKWHIRLTRPPFTRFLRDRNRASIITRLDLSDLYWIPSGVIRDLTIGMSSLQTLLVAGTSLSWMHLAQILKTLHIEKLSWSWDNKLEESVRKRSSISPTKYAELIEMKAQFLQLKCFMVHVPMSAKVATDLLFYSFSALAFIISLCKNLEELWLLSWPKTSMERKCSSDLSREDLEEDDVDLPQLHTLVISVKETPRISTPRLVSQLMQSLRRNKNQTKIRSLWLDHPLLGVTQPSPTVNRPSIRGMRDRSWPQEVNLVNAERISYPLMYHMSGVANRFDYPNLKHLLVSHGAPIVVNLNGVFENSKHLESFCCTAFNVRVDWKRFAVMHPKLKEISINETEGLENYCVSFSKLTDLKELSLPLECLLEIKDSVALSDYSISQVLKDNRVKDNNDSTVDLSSTMGSSSGYQEKTLFKKRRLGAPSKPTDPNASQRVSGLHLLTTGCPKVNQLEIGFGKSNRSKAGRILVDSLFSISKWKNLRKLSLNLLPVINGKFLIEIFSACNLIESIRLSHLGHSGRCCYVRDLNQALSYCKNLRDFRLEQTYIGSTVSMFQSLQGCQKLRRLLIWSSPNDEPLQSEVVENLFEKCTDLMMFYATIDSTTKSVCFQTRKSLEAKYRKERPALSIVIRNTLEEDGLINYPSIHYRQMVLNSPQICQFNNFPEFGSL